MRTSNPLSSMKPCPQALPRTNIFQCLCSFMAKPGDEANVPVATHVKLNANNVGSRHYMIMNKVFPLTLYIMI